MRRVNLHPGVKVTISTNVKDELVLEGESLDNVSQSAASIQQLESSLQSLQPAIAMLNLVRPGLQRGAGEQLPEVRVNSGTKALHIEVARLVWAGTRHTGGRC